MRQAVVCSRCARPIPSRSTNPLAGCPFCFVQDALGAEPAPPVESARRPARLGKYSLSAKLGAGGMGEVWKAWDAELERWVALKLLRDEDSRESERFTREARTAAALTHPSIAAVYETGEIDGRPFIAMQLVVGRTLDQSPRKDRSQLVSLLREAARAVGVAHKHGIVHRDIKPANLMVEEGEGGSRIMVMDFGLARRIEGGKKISGTATLAGTPAYMSPEHTRGRQADARSDVYSLGVTLYEMLTGRLPFQSDDLYLLIRKITDADPAPPRTIDRSIDRDLDTIVMKCLDKDPSRRYPTGDALAKDLDRWLAGEPVLARPAGLIHRVGRKIARLKAAVAAVLATSVLLALVGWWISVGSPTNRHLKLMAEGSTLWAEARGVAMLGVDPEGARHKAQRAREKFEEAIQSRDEAEANWMRGRCLQLEGRNDEAMKALERAHALNPDHADSRVDLAKFLFLQYQDSRAATASFLVNPDGRVTFEAEALPPETDDQRRLREEGMNLLSAGEVPRGLRHLMIGLQAMGRGNNAEAAKALAQYTREERWDALGWFHQGVALVFIKDLPGALAALNQSVAASGNESDYIWRGGVHLLLDRPDEAIKDYTVAIERNPKEVNAWEGRAVAFSRKKLHLEAIRDLERADAIAPNRAKLHNNLGAEYHALDQREKAIDQYSRAIALASPPDWICYYNRARARIEQRSPREALQDLEQVLTLRPNYARAINQRGLAKAQLGSEKEAEADWSKAIELDSKLDTAWTYRGTAKMNRGAFRDAIQDFTKAIELNPAEPTSWGGKGACHYMLEQYDQAISDLTEALKLDPKKVRYLVHRGEAKRFKGQPAEAIKDYTSAIELDEKNPGPWHWRAHAYSALGDRKNAHANLKQALLLAPPGWEWRAEVEKELKDHTGPE